VAEILDLVHAFKQYFEIVPAFSEALSVYSNQSLSRYFCNGAIEQD